MTIELSCWALLVFAALANLIGHALARYDKKQARLHGSRADRRSNTDRRDRIPEKTFHTLALFGAGPGILLAFFMVRHKTRKLRFLVPFVLATLVGVALLTGWWVLLC